MSKDFDKPLNEWVEETVDVPVMTPKVNEAESRVEFTQTTKKVKQKTMYVNSPRKKVVCSSGTHVFACLDKGKYIFKCLNCDWHKVAFPVTFKFDPDTGILSYRRTGIRL